jgi:acetoin utilization protein AcuB
MRGGKESRSSGKARMLLVKDSMTREVVTLSPQTTAGEALALCRERRIRHLPVLDGGRLVGIVSDRDLRSATPALGDPARAEALRRILVPEVMAREVATIHPDDPIEEAANAMREKTIGCLPVVENGALLGIVTSSDVMEALVYLMGAHEPGNRLEVVMPDRPGTLAGVAGIFGELGINIVSVVAGPRHPLPEGSEPGRVAVFRVDTMDLREAVEILGRAGYAVLWPPSL